MFVIESTGQTLSLDQAFVLNDVQYPANWLRCATIEERQALGIVEMADPQPYDQRFYWGRDADGNLLPMDVADLKVRWVDITRTTANTLLAPTDWMVVRQADNGKEMPADTKSLRQAIREACEAKVTALEACVDTPALAAYVCSPEYAVWPPEVYTPPAPEPAPEVDPDQPLPLEHPSLNNAQT